MWLNFFRTAQSYEAEGSSARPSGLYAQVPASHSQARGGGAGSNAERSEDTAAAEAGRRKPSACGAAGGKAGKQLRAASRPVVEESEGTEPRHPPLREKGVEGEAGAPARSSTFGLPQRLEEAAVRGRAAGAVVRRRRERERGR